MTTTTLPSTTTTSPSAGVGEVFRNMADPGEMVRGMYSWLWRTVSEHWLESLLVVLAVGVWLSWRTFREAVWGR